MKSIIICLLTVLALPVVSSPLFAQQPAGNERLSVGTIEPYYLEVTYHKTSHLLFPSHIRYVDLGSDYLIAGKADDAENVLRIKAAVKDFTAETNFSVITGDGRFYNFDVHYSPEPATLNFDIREMERQRNTGLPDYGSGVLFDELGTDPPQLTDQLLEMIYKSNRRFVRHIASRSNNILCMLNGIYIHSGRLYFHLEIRNNSNIPFPVDYVSFRIVDKKVLKRSAVQEKPEIVLRSYRPVGEIAGRSAGRNVFLLDRFTMTGDKILLIEIFEKKGGRHQVLKVENADLINARPIDDPHQNIR